MWPHDIKNSKISAFFRNKYNKAFKIKQISKIFGNICVDIEKEYVFFEKSS